MSALHLLLALAGLLLLAGCRPTRHVSARGPEVTPPPKVDQRLPAAHNRFGLKLLAALRQKQPDENVFISPTSIALALAMTYNGAAGETQQAMAAALELRGLSPAAVNEAGATLLSSLRHADPEVKLAIANSLWGDKGVTFAPDFLRANEASYEAGLSVLDLQAPGAAETINQWVSDHTEGKIPGIVTDQDLMAAIALVLVNAVYFEGKWTTVFDRDGTKDQPFTLLDGSRKTLPMMTQLGHFAYLEQPGLQAIRLPYGRQRLAMYVFLPAKGGSVDELCRSLTAEQWEDWLSRFANARGTISLPRFKTEYAAKLNDVLKALGMGIALDEMRADFSAMVDPPARELWIGFVKHRTYLEVDEEGTKAAAVTAVGMEAGAAPAPTKPFTMVVDRPFLCAIADRVTGELLFIGTIMNPQS